MDLNFGINGSISAEAARPVTINSSSPVAIAATSDTHATGRTFYGDPEAAYDAVKEDTGGNLRLALRLLADQGVACPVLVHAVRTDADPAVEKAALVAEIQDMVNDYGETGVRPQLIVCPDYSYEVDVAAAMDAVASQLWALAVVDCQAADETEATTWAQNFGSRHLLLYGPKVKIQDTLNATVADVAVSPGIAGLIARLDGERPFGWADSPSNRILKGVSGTDRIVGFAEGQDSEARRLRQAGIGSIVRDTGWRTWGAETTDVDPIWEVLERVRSFYRMLRGMMEASKWARDRRADELLYVRDSVETFLLEAKGNGAVLGFEAEFPAEKNTKATVTAGKFYLDVKTQNMPTVRELNIELIYTDEYSDVLLNFING